MKKRMAIIGSGIAGMSAAYFLKDEYEISIFEKNDYPGGHTNTINVHDGKKDCPMDTGFMVFNEKTYPNLLKLFAELDVSYKDTDMSFSVRNEELNIEYNGSSLLNGLFAQKKNIFNPKFLQMISHILKFNGDALKMLEDPKLDGLSIGEYVSRLGLSDYFFDNFLVPMSSAVWSTPVEKMKDFPAKSLVRFFKNHGFVGVNTQLQWKTVVDGSQQYKDKILAFFPNSLFINDGVKEVWEENGRVEIKTERGQFQFDKVIIASHADEALAMLKMPSEKQRNVLDKFSYQENEAVVHTDPNVMPKLKKNWSSWNFLMREDQSYTVYYMNRLQGVSEEVDFFININGGEFVDEKKVIKRFVYHHPLFDVPAVMAQGQIDELNKSSNIMFTGSYYRYGFHEDALLSSVNLCSSILGRSVWQ